MSWCDLLFAHWPVEPGRLRPLIPAGLEIDTHQGQAWLGVVPFVMRNVTLLGDFAELNLRTYVRCGGKPGVWFFSLDAASRLAVRGARWTFHLPYFDAAMHAEPGADGEIRYRSRRAHRGAPAAELDISYRSIGPVRLSTPGTLEHWQTERYCLFTVDRDGRILRGDIEHQQWPLEDASAEIGRNTLGDGFGLELAGPPVTLAFAKRVDVSARWPVRA